MLLFYQISFTFTRDSSEQSFLPHHLPFERLKFSYLSGIMVAFFLKYGALYSIKYSLFRVRKTIQMKGFSYE